MNRAEWRRIQFLKVDLVYPGCRYRGQLSGLKAIVDHWASRPAQTSFPGERTPRKVIMSSDGERWPPYRTTIVPDFDHRPEKATPCGD
jgi:hypothetical protein